MHVHLVNPSHVSFGIAITTPRWLYVLAGATTPEWGDPVLTDEMLEPARWDIMPRERYMWASVQTVRGCPKHGSFYSVWRTDGQEPRQSASDVVVEEIVQLRRMGFRFIALADDNVFPVTLNDFATAARREDQEFLEAMGKARIKGVCVGIESVTEEGLPDGRQHRGRDRQRADVAGDPVGTYASQAHAALVRRRADAGLTGSPDYARHYYDQPCRRRVGSCGGVSPVDAVCAIHSLTRRTLSLQRSSSVICHSAPPRRSWKQCSPRSAR